MGKQANGRGTIKKRSDGRWEAQYTVHYERKSIYGKTEAEVAKKLNQVLYEIESGAFVNDTVTVEQWLHTWLSEYVKGHVKQKTYQGYEINVRVHLVPALKKIKLKHLTADQVQRLLNQKIKDGLSTNTVSYIKRTLHAALGEAIRNGLLIRNVAHGAKVQSVKKKDRRILTLQEQESLIKALEGKHWGFAVEFALFTGLRAGELLGLRWCDVDMKEKVITIRQTVQRLYGEDGKSRLQFDTPKTSKSNRTIPLLGKLADKLHRHYTKQLKERERVGELWEDNNLVFCTELGKPIDSSNFSRFLANMSEKAGIPRVNIHCLRHSFTTRARDMGVELEVVSEFLGHSDIRLTANVYTSVLMERKKSEMQKMNKLFKKGGKV